MIKLICALTLILSISSLHAGWLDRKAEGWAWYEDREKEPTEEPKPEKIAPPVMFPPPIPIEKPLSPTDELEQVKKAYEEALARAVLNPTNENVTQLMLEQKKRMEQSTLFAKVWSKTLLQHPELDETVTGFPVSQYGIQLQKQLVQEQKEALIKGLSQECGLFFFYQGSSKVSAAFSMVVREFARRYNWQVLAISVDGVTLDAFPNQKVDNGISRQFGIKQFPALFIVHPASQEIVPIAFGLTTLDQIENNITLQFTSAIPAERGLP